MTTNPNPPPPPPPPPPPQPTQAPVLSTPDESHIFEDPTPVSAQDLRPRYTDAQLWDVYEVVRTAREVCDKGYRRVALQFPDGMLRDAPRVVGALESEVMRIGKEGGAKREIGDTGRLGEEGTDAGLKGEESVVAGQEMETSFNDLAITSTANKNLERIRFYILADTSYGSCCVDEIAAEHASANVVVHYGRSCLSPTARLPVIYVFTSHPLDIEAVVGSFEATFPSKDEKVLLMADITYHVHIPAIQSQLQDRGYTNLVAPEVIHDPESVVPNRRLEEGVRGALGEYSVFHISDPPTALLLTLDSRVKGLFIYPTATPSSSPTSKSQTQAITPSTHTPRLLRRRYGILTSLSTCPIFGILINTLSVKNYLSTVTVLQKLIASKGKKSYTFVVGKVNAAKIANFAEIGGWVVVGCWESSLVESGEFYKPLITPYELGLCLMGDEERVWDGSWEGGFGSVRDASLKGKGAENGSAAVDASENRAEDEGKQSEEIQHDADDSEPESAPPEFDLRTGRYVSHSRPMASHNPSSTTTNSTPKEASSSTQPSNPSPTSPTPENKLIKRAKGDLATINGAVSPGAEFLRSQRTWTGLGSDFADADADANADGDGDGDAKGAGGGAAAAMQGGTIEEGRRGVARGYVVGDDEERR